MESACPEPAEWASWKVVDPGLVLREVALTKSAPGLVLLVLREVALTKSAAPGLVLREVADLGLVQDRPDPMPGEAALSNSVGLEQEPAVGRVASIPYLVAAAVSHLPSHPPSLDPSVPWLATSQGRQTSGPEASAVWGRPVPAPSEPQEHQNCLAEAEAALRLPSLPASLADCPATWDSSREHSDILVLQASQLPARFAFPPVHRASPYRVPQEEVGRPSRPACPKEARTSAQHPVRQAAHPYWVRWAVHPYLVGHNRGPFPAAGLRASAVRRPSPAAALFHPARAPARSAGRSRDKGKQTRRRPRLFRTTGSVSRQPPGTAIAAPKE